MPLSNLVRASTARRALVVVALSLAACTDHEMPTATIAPAAANAIGSERADPARRAAAASPALAVVPASVSITQGRTLPFFALNIDPLNAQQASAPITWSSSNPAVATVSGTGVVRGVAPGAATITASALNGQFVATSAVTILPTPNCQQPSPLPTDLTGALQPIPTGYEDTPLFFRLAVVGDSDPCHRYTFRIPEVPVAGILYQVGEDGSPLTTAITAGMTVTNSEGWVAFYPRIPGYYGPDSFRYSVTDENGRVFQFFPPVPFWILPVNDPPVAMPQVHLGDNRYPITNVLLQATDIDDFQNQVDMCIETLPQTGDLYWQTVAPANRVVAGDCRPVSSLRYVSRIADANVCSVKPPKSAYPLTDSFRWFASDRTAASDVVTGGISVQYYNETPSYLGPARAVTSEDTPVTFTLGGSDPDGDALTLELHAQPRHGTLFREDGTQVLFYPALFLLPARLTYVPTTNFNTLTESDDIQFMVSDGYPNPCISKVHFDVTPVNDAPTITAPTTVTADGSPAGVTINGISVADDARPTDVLSITLRAQGPAAGRVDLAGPPGLSWRRVSPKELTVAGTIASINALLNRGVTWAPNGPGPNYGELAIIVDDRGNFGAGGRLVGTTIVPIDVAGEIIGPGAIRAAPPAGAPTRRPDPDRR